MTISSSSWQVVFVALALAVASWPADAQRTRGRALPAQTAGPWTRYENLQPVLGVDGKMHEATCSGYPGTDPSFSFWAKRGAENNLVVFFDGGGACWDDLTCTFPMTEAPDQVLQFYAPAISPTRNPAGFDGIFRTDLAANPVRDWSFVYIPYCTGDVHLGSGTRQYTNVGPPRLPLPPTFEIRHRGFDNFMVVLDWMRRNVGAPQKILVTGSSAGGYGASGNFPWIKEAFPAAEVHVIADASQGVTPPAFDSGNPGRNSWSPTLAPWIYGVDPSPVRSADILLRAAEYYPGVRVAQFTTRFDGVQIGFYAAAELTTAPGGSCRNPLVDWNQQMVATLGGYIGTAPNFRYYVPRGTYHTIMGQPEFYSESTGSVAYADWVAAMLQGGDLWRNVACPACLTPAPCR